jgi:protein SCO1/2
LTLFAGLLAAAALPARTFAFGPERDGATVNTADIGGINVTEHPGTLLPPDLKFVDETGKPVRLGDYFTGKRPVVLQLGYYQCPMLCNLISQGTVNAFKAVSLEPNKDYDLVFVSIDPSETPPLASQKKQAFAKELGKGGLEGWHFLTGRQPEIESLAKTVGFNYRWVQSAGQFSHPAVIMMCMPDGKVSRYLYGVRFDPTTVRESLVEASNGKIGNSFDQLYLTCFQYDGHQGKYAVAAIGIMRGGGVLIIVIVAAVLIRLLRKELKEKALEAGQGFEVDSNQRPRK